MMYDRRWPRFGFARKGDRKIDPRPSRPRNVGKPTGNIRLALERLEPRQLLATQVVITEFLASNNGGLRDADGTSPDWIEIFNRGDAPIDLQGYHLTDDATQLDRWTFPSVNLDPGEQLVVFASGKEDGSFVDAQGNLHTNFSLRRAGEYVALVAPDLTISSEFGLGRQDYPEQLANVSYGIAQGLPLVEVASPGTYLIPTGGQAEGNWMQPGFDALGNGFAVGTAALGFETKPNDRTNFSAEIVTELPDTAHAVYTRFEFGLLDASGVASLKLRLKYDNGFVAYLNGVKVAEDNVPAALSWFATAPSGPRRDTDVLEFVELDLREHADLLVDGNNVLAIHGLNYPGDATDMLLVAELLAGVADMEAAAGVPARIGYLPNPTPGAPNSSNAEVFSGFVTDTSFLVDRGFYDSPQRVEIATETEGADIYYTTDGSSPHPDNASATLYSGALTIDHTTTLRAAAYQRDFLPTNVDTQTYLFTADVATQDFQAGLDAGFPETWGRFSAEYGLDPKVIGPDDMFDGRFAEQLIDSLRDVPSVSLVTDLENLFGPTGILDNPGRSGIEWERPASMEWINSDGSTGFQTDAGVRIQGDASRDYSNSKKLSFRFAFRGQYGDTRLVYPLFGENATDRFDTIRLRASYNDGSVHTPRSTQHIRDEWMRRTLLAMGQPNAHGTFLHVYINGLYWGLYNVVERPDEAFAATYFGGNKDDWDAISASVAQNGSITAWRDLGSESANVAAATDAQASNAAYQRLLGNNPDGTNDPDLETLLDVDNYIDYLIANFYGGNGDWPGRNYYAAREQGPGSTGFKFFSWDAEKVLGHEEGATVTANRLGANTDVALFYGRLRDNDEFRLRFADRVQQHFFNGGALYVEPESPEWNPERPETNVPAARYDELARQVELALVAEYARWGDTARRSADQLPGGVSRLVTSDDWAAFRDGLLADYFPRRSAIVLDQFRRAGLYPNTDAPVLSQHGGVIRAGSSLTIGGRGDIYYTIDGSDPRLLGGDVLPNAVKFETEIVLDASATVKSRVFSGGEWSALTEATFLIASDYPLRVTEINYHGHQANLVSGLGEIDAASDQFEFVEVMNVGPQPIDLANVRFEQTDVRGDDQGIRFTFATQMLAAGERVVIVRDRQAFQSRYGAAVGLAAGNDGDGGGEGEYGGRLSDDGEQLTLLDPNGRVIQQFTYRTVGRTDGGGSSLEVVNVAGNDASRTNWRESSEFGGSPASPGTGPQASTIVINELLANTEGASGDRVELFNGGAFDVNVAHWYISDTADDYFQSKIATSMVIPAFSYQVLSESDLGFGLENARGSQLWLVSADANGRPLRFVDHVEFPASAKGVSVGPWPTRGAEFLPLSQTTFGGPNADRRVGDVIISEVHYNPADPDGEGGLRVKDLEFIEVFNTTDRSIELTGWRLTGDVAIDIPRGTILGAGQTLVLVGFDSANANKASVFRFSYAASSDVALIGPLIDARNQRLASGVIDDLGAQIRLVRPGVVSAGEPDFVPQLVVDQIEYRVSAAWPRSPAGTGDSLSRTGPEGYGRFPISWVGATPTPGRTEFFERLSGDANDDGQFDQSDIQRVLQTGKYLTGELASWLDGDWNGDGQFSQLDVVAALQAGRYLVAPAPARQDARPSPAADVERWAVDAAMQER